ncbi:hypothetical protein JL722_9123 [Aureococcus anophagefferens]|nr:hypothetical protein JL722_9123 [Aureococcus anophagefferens]
MARDDAEEALVVEDFEYSAAQQRYQVEAQSQRGNNDAMREELFYKDATPKAEHYISFVAPSAPGEDYVTVPDQGHLKRCEPARRDGDPKGPSERRGWAPPAAVPPGRAQVVASKVKRPRAALRDDDGDEDDDRASSSPPPPSKRAHLNGRGAPLLPARIEARLGTAVPEMDGLDPEEADVLQHLVANAPGDGADLFAPFYPSDGTPWADMMSTMGSGLDGVPHSLANTQEDS